MRGSLTRLLVITGLALVLPVCGGGGGGRTSPTAPPPLAGPSPDTSQVSSDSLYGQVTGLFDPSSNFAGSTIKVPGTGSDTVRTDNSFRIESVAPGEHVLVVHGDGFLDRKVEIEMLAGGANEIPQLDLAENGSFDLASFDEIYREDGESGTARMMRRPHFRVAKKEFDALSGSKGSRLMANIEEEITGSLKRAVRPFLNGVQITYENRLARYEEECNPDLGAIDIFAEKRLRNEDGDALWGQASWCWWPERREVSGGMIILDDEAGAGVVLHEAIHILGSAGHLMTNPESSIMAEYLHMNDLSRMDEQHLRFLFHRSPGVKSPDDARGLGAGDLTRLSSGGAGLRATCQIFPDGTARIEYRFDSPFRH